MAENQNKVMNKKINPIKLKSMANSIAKSYGDKGAIVITMGDEGIRIGTQGLTFGEVREALCVAIHYCYCFEDDLLASEKQGG
uniref:Uncharacterized protein n=1 Tax=viral metagenome TaxID=1070528 RepID=A0A6M3K1I0_9ZZZZ